MGILVARLSAIYGDKNLYSVQIYTVSPINSFTLDPLIRFSCQSHKCHANMYSVSRMTIMTVWGEEEQSGLESHVKLLKRTPIIILMAQLERAEAF